MEILKIPKQLSETDEERLIELKKQLDELQKHGLNDETIVTEYKELINKKHKI